MRWVGSMVADVYRILIRGGVYLYPEDSREGYERGRLRLLYEANPVAFLIEQAGGAAIDGYRRILDDPAGIDPCPHTAHFRREGQGRARALATTMRKAWRCGRRCSASAACCAVNIRGGQTHVHQTSHHRDHRLVGGRNHIGQEDFRADFSSRDDQPSLYRGRRLPSLEPHRDARADEGGGCARRQSLQPLRIGREPVRGARKLVPILFRDGRRQDPRLRARRASRRRRMASRPASSRIGARSSRARICCSTKGCTGPS